MNKPIYQKIVESWVPWMFLGLFFVGSFLDTLVNASQIITPTMTWTGTIAIFVVTALLYILLPRLSLPWILENNTKVRIKALGRKPLFIIAGILIALWLPRLMEPIIVSKEKSELLDNYSLVSAELDNCILDLENRIEIEKAVVNLKISKVSGPNSAPPLCIPNTWIRISQEPKFRKYMSSNMQSNIIVFVNDLNTFQSTYNFILSNSLASSELLSFFKNMKWNLEFQRDFLSKGEMLFVQNRMSGSEMNELSNRLVIESVDKLEQMTNQP